MPPRLALRPALDRGRGAWKKLPPRSDPFVCFLCSLSLARRPSALTSPARRRPDPLISARRAQSTESSAATTTTTPENPRRELERALLDLQKHAGQHVNLSRLQLALRNLAQEPGRESVRVALVGLGGINGAEGSETARSLLRLALADPLKDEEEWERQLGGYDQSQAILVRIREHSTEEPGKIEFAKDKVLPEIDVSCPGLNGHDLEILLRPVPAPIPGGGEAVAAEEDALVPIINAPTSTPDRLMPVTSPVHKALVVGDGLAGAATAVASYPHQTDSIATAINLKSQLTPDDIGGSSITVVNVDMAAKALGLFRESVGNARQYETLWTESGVGKVVEWLKSGILCNEGGSTKAPVRSLVKSVLHQAEVEIQNKEARQQGSGLSETAIVAKLNKALSGWAQEAHEELQEQLDLAFTGRRWRKLGWWKLFWRVDDVGMLSSDMLAQRFLPEAERGIIFLAGRIEEAGATPKGLEPAAHIGLDAPRATKETSASQRNTLLRDRKWLTHIPHTRDYLLEKTVPALQALAQSLVAQSLSTSALTTILGGLWYLSTFSAYEAGAIAAVGVVWSLRRLQKKWETAREFWEGEVREEGRKAVRSTETSVAQVLDLASKSRDSRDGAAAELTRARDMVRTAKEALERLK